MPDSTATVAPSQVEALRGFNRFYTRHIGILAPYPGGDLTLTEARVLYELAQGAGPAQQGMLAAQIAADLGLDAGYLSRILRRFEARGWVGRSRCEFDRRQHWLRLTPAGAVVLRPLQQKSIAQAEGVLAALDPPRRDRLMAAMHTLQGLLAPVPAPQAQDPVQLRMPGPGDMGWVVEQHGAIYAREYGLDSRFEALVARVAADILSRFQPQWERGWIAHRGEQRLGSAFVVRKSATVAQLRLLILVPQARGLGLGARLTDACIAFAREKGYRKMVLWTNSCLGAARDIYSRRGFMLRKSAPYHDFGQDLVGETWELRL